MLSDERLDEIRKNYDEGLFCFKSWKMLEDLLTEIDRTRGSQQGSIRRQAARTGLHRAQRRGARHEHRRSQPARGI